MSGLQRWFPIGILVVIILLLTGGLLMDNNRKGVKQIIDGCKATELFAINPHNGKSLIRIYDCEKEDESTTT